MEPKTYTDAEVTDACALHLDNLRRLITWGAVQPVQARGGRGRVRRWTFQQAMRIAVTAEFVDAGFSLKMAHTLTYCLPLDDMLSLYDPEFIQQRVLNQAECGDERIKELINAESDSYWPDENDIGNIIIINRCLVYADVLGETPYLFGLIDPDENRYWPTYDPKNFLWGMIFNLNPEVEKRAAISDVNPNSLLIDDLYFSKTQEEISEFSARITRGLSHQLDDPEDQNYRNYLKIRLSTGLSIAFRRLMGFPVNYSTINEQLNG